MRFCYRVISYDVILGGATGRLWDSLDVTVDDQVKFRTGNTDPYGQGQRYDSLWQEASVSLAEYRGRTVRIRFAVWNREYDGNGLDYYNTWAYVDNVSLVP